MRKFKVTHKIAIVLVTLSCGPLLAAALSGIIPLKNEALFKARASATQNLAIACSPYLERNEQQKLQQHIRAMLQSEPSIRELRIRRFDNYVFFETPEHAKLWTLEDEHSTIDQMTLPIRRGNKKWANLEVIFESQPWYAHGWGRLGLLIGLVAVLNGMTFLLFLNRVLSVLDPNNAVPKRVRNTLDTIAGGVVVLDSGGRIMLANESFALSVAQTPAGLVGSRLESLPWKLDENEKVPWEVVLSENKRIEGTKIFLPTITGANRCFVVNATPVQDAKDRLAGALISFEDVTALEGQRQDLVKALSELEASREQIRKQNEKLQELASRDALTGAINRRALFEHFESMWNTKDDHQIGMVAMMMDIDHFKKLNDKHGHAAGDSVLKSVVKVLHATVADRGIVGRYGGEEFCVIVADCTTEEGLEIAERIRQNIQTELRTPYAVTTSVGISSSLNGAPTMQSLLEQADKSLYAAKHGGRNTVRHWTPEIDLLEQENQRKALAAQNLSVIDDHPISYHAVVSLHAALTYRHADTAVHSQRVAEYAVSLGRGLMPVSELYVLEIAALLHDIGKIGVPDAVLLKPGRLTDEEWRFMEAHGPIGVAIVKAAFDCAAITDVLQYHHCRFDGKDQDPSLPSGKNIPLAARIVCIVDAFDAMVSDRVYRKGRSFEEAFAELRRCAGSQFDPELVERFVEQQTGWRVDSRFLMLDMPEKEAVSLGFHLERVIHSFEIRDPVSLKQRLEILKSCAVKCDLPHVAAIANELCKDADRKTIADWDTILPVLGDLIDNCLMVQRAYLRHVGAKPMETKDCRSNAFLLGKAEDQIANNLLVSLTASTL